MMPIASIISGLTALAGSGMAVAKMIRDDKQSKYPPEYLMYKDMMKDARKYGYPTMGMMQPSMMTPQVIQPPQNAMLPMMTNGGIVQQVIQEYQKQQLKQQIVNAVVQQVVQRILCQPNQPRRYGYGYGTIQPTYNRPYTPPPLPTLTYVQQKPMWDTPADGVVPSSPPQPCYQLATIPKPLPMPQPCPQQMYATATVVNPLPAPQPIPVIPFRQPEHLINESVVRTQPPPIVYPNQQQLRWDTPNASSVDSQGLQSFVNHLSHPKVPDNYVGNTLDW